MARNISIYQIIGDDNLLYYTIFKALQAMHQSKIDRDLDCTKIYSCNTKQISFIISQL